MYKEIILIWAITFIVWGYTIILYKLSDVDIKYIILFYVIFLVVKKIKED